MDSTSGSTEWVGVTQAKKWGTNGSQVELIALDRTTNVWKGIYIQNDNGECIISGVTPSDKTNNSTQFATTAWVNQSNFLVHTTGNEEISGSKTFTSEPAIAYDGCKLVLRNTEYNMGANLSSYYTHNIVFVDKNNVYGGAIQKRVDANGDSYLTVETQNNAKTATSTIRIYAKNNGSKYATAPTTPTNATENEIATANWVNNKLAGKIHISANAPTASDGNDGDIWLQYV